MSEQNRALDLLPDGWWKKHDMRLLLIKRGVSGPEATIDYLHGSGQLECELDPMHGWIYRKTPTASE